MSDIKLSQLPVLATLPLEVAIVPVVQGGVTYAVPLAQTREGVWMPPPDTAANNVINLQAAITAATTSTVGKKVFVPAGTYDLNNTVYAQNVFGLQLIGSGMQTVFNWTLNDNTKPMFKLYGRQCVFSSFQMTFAQVCYAGIQILRDNAGTHTVTPTNNRLENVFISGSAKAVYGVMLGGTGSTDANNDFNVIEQCGINNYTDTGVYVGGTQSYGNRILNSRIVGDGVNSQYAVNSGGAGGCYSVMGGTAGGHLTADFGVGRHYQPYRIQDVVSEGSSRFLSAPSALWRVIFVEGCRYAGNALNADLKAVKIDGYGKYFMRGNRFGDGQATIAALTLEFLNLGSLSNVSFDGNDLFTTSGHVLGSITPDSFVKNTKITDEGLFTTGSAVALIGGLDTGDALIEAAITNPDLKRSLIQSVELLAKYDSGELLPENIVIDPDKKKAYLHEALVA